MNTLAEQFAQDWLLVIENDQDSWNQLVEDVKSMDCHMISTIAYLREEWDVLIDQMADAVEDKVSEVGALLLRQMLSTGDYPFQLIANHVISSIQETNKHQPEVNDLVKNMEESNA
jgi:hypothetical protein